MPLNVAHHDSLLWSVVLWFMNHQIWKCSWENGFWTICLHYPLYCVYKIFSWLIIYGVTEQIIPAWPKFRVNHAKTSSKNFYKESINDRILLDISWKSTENRIRFLKNWKLMMLFTIVVYFRQTAYSYELLFLTPNFCTDFLVIQELILISNYNWKNVFTMTLWWPTRYLNCDKSAFKWMPKGRY